MNTEEILWKSISDIEGGLAKTSKQDPIDGWLDEKSRRGLTKINVCAQSAKYTANNKPLSRPTLDSYSNVIEYISGTSKSKDILEENKNLKERLRLSNEVNNDMKEAIEKTASENYELNERVRILENKLKNSIKVVDQD